MWPGPYSSFWANLYEVNTIKNKSTVLKIMLFQLIRSLSGNFSQKDEEPPWIWQATCKNL